MSASNAALATKLDALAQLAAEPSSERRRVLLREATDALGYLNSTCRV